MAILELQSFSTTSTLSQLGGTITESAAIVVGNGRLAGNTLNAPNVNDYWTKASVFANTATLTIGHAFYYGGYPGADTICTVLTDGGSRQLEWGINTAGCIFVNRAGTRLATSTRQVLPGVWHYIEMEATIGNSGSVKIWLNGEELTELTLSGVDTQATANAYANGYTIGTCYLGGQATLSGGYWCDLYVATTRLGDMRVAVIKPTAEGNTTQWTPSTGTDNALNVDEIPPNDNTDYNSDATVGDKDTYVTSDLPVAATTVHALKVKLRAQKTDAGTRSIQPVIRHSGTDYDGTGVALATGYTYIDQLYVTNPGTAAAWTESDVNNAEFGVKVSA